MSLPIIKIIYLKCLLLITGTYCVGLTNDLVIRTDNLQNGSKIEEENCQSLTYVILRNFWTHQRVSNKIGLNPSICPYVKLEHSSNSTY